jgi:glycerate-2-kinase
MTREELDALWFQAMRQSIEAGEDFIRYHFAALVAAAEQKPISDVTEAVTKTVIDVEKLLCEKIGRQWQPSGMSIQTLVDELAALVAAAEREACAELCEEMEDRENPYERNVAVLDCAAAIRARGEA